MTLDENRPLAPDEEAVFESALRRSGVQVIGQMPMAEPRGQVEWTTVPVPLLAEIQRNPDGTWTGMVRRLSRVVLTRETREGLLQALAELHAQKAPK